MHFGWRRLGPLGYTAVSCMKIIVNPLAVRENGDRFIERLHRLLKRFDLSGEILFTSGPGHATELSRELATSGERRIVVVGGDGTISEVATGLVGTEVELGILSLGTGNDVARSLGLPYRNLAAGLEILSAGFVRRIDVGWERDRHFVSMLGLGFPTQVARQTERLRWLRGSAAFFVAVYKVLYRMKSVPMKIRLDDRELAMSCTSVMIHNTPYTGGGLLMAPTASLDDGYFDVVIIDAIGKLDLLWNFPKAYRGRHLGHPRFSLYRSKKVRIESSERLEKLFDGDVYGEAPVEARVLPKALKVIVPPGG